MSILAADRPAQNMAEPFKQLPSMRLLIDYAGGTDAVISSSDPGAKTVTRTGAPLLHTMQGGGPYMEFDGAADILQIADGSWDAPLKETTLVVVFRATTLHNATLAGVWTAAGLSFRLDIRSTGAIRASISDDGTSVDDAEKAAAYQAETWTLAALTYEPSVRLRVITVENGVTANTSSIPAALHNSADPFCVAANDAALNNILNGDVALAIVAGCVAHKDVFGDLLWPHVQPFLS